jgi:hypothetical protein
MGGDMVVVTMGTSASRNILWHLSSGFVTNIGVVVGFTGFISGSKCGLPGPTRLASVHRVAGCFIIEFGIPFLRREISIRILLLESLNIESLSERQRVLGLQHKDN